MQTNHKWEKQISGCLGTRVCGGKGGRCGHRAHTLLREISIDCADGFIGVYVSKHILKICVLCCMFIIPQQRYHLNEGSCKDLAWKWVNGQAAGSRTRSAGVFQSQQTGQRTLEVGAAADPTSQEVWLARMMTSTPTLAVPSSPLWGADTCNEPSFKTEHGFGKDNSPKVNWGGYLERKCIQEKQKQKQKK